jgi:hypothetical protein
MYPDQKVALPAPKETEGNAVFCSFLYLFSATPHTFVTGEIEQQLRSH